MHKLLNIARFAVATVILSALFAVASAQQKENVVHQGETTPLSVVEVPGETYLWELYVDSTQNFATYPGDCPTNLADFVGGNTGAAVQVHWKQPGIYFFKVTAYSVTGCTDNIGIGRMKVVPSIPTAKLFPVAICQGDPLKIHVSLKGTPPFSFWITDGKNSFGPYTAVPDTAYDAVINPPPKISTEYWVKEGLRDTWGINPATSDTVLQVVNPKPDMSPIYRKP